MLPWSDPAHGQMVDFLEGMVDFLEGIILPWSDGGFPGVILHCSHRCMLPMPTYTLQPQVHLFGQCQASIVYLDVYLSHILSGG